MMNDEMMKVAVTSYVKEQSALLEAHSFYTLFPSSRDSFAF